MKPHRALTDEQIATILVYKRDWTITPRQVKQIATRAERTLRKDPAMRQLAIAFDMEPDDPEHDENETWPCSDCPAELPHTGFYWDCYGNRTRRCKTCHRTYVSQRARGTH